MTCKIKAMILIAAMAAPTLAGAQEKPPSPPNASVYAGPCVNPALSGPKTNDDKDESAFLTAFLGAAVPKLIGAGLDWIGAKLAELGEDQKTVVAGARTSETAFGARYCVQISRRAATGGQTLDALMAAPQFANWPKPESAPRIARDQPMDFFVEFWVRPSQAGDAISLTPTLLYYPRQLGAKNGEKDTAIVVASRLEPFGATAASSTWAFSRQTPTAGLQAFLEPRPGDDGLKRLRGGDLLRLCETGCELASPWMANPWVKGVKGSNTGMAAAVAAPGTTAAYSEKATNIRLEVTEIRAGSKFFKALSQAFVAAKPVAQSELEQLLLADKRAAADATASNAAATALNGYAGKLGEAEAARTKYCAAKTVAGTNWTVLSAELRARQLLANVAAAAADVPEPFQPPIAVGNALVSAVCP